MKNQVKILVLVIVVIRAVLLTGSFACANGGPFVLKYPNGDPAARGVLARLDPDLKPGRETRLRVIKEDLRVTFGKDKFPLKSNDVLPLVQVSAEYTIENPTDEQVNVDFGFPILRGIYVDPFSMMPKPDVSIRMGNTYLKPTIISNSAIYSIIRRQAREVIEKAITCDEILRELIDSIYDKKGQERENARRAIHTYLTDTMKWNKRNAALMVEYASLDFGKIQSLPFDRDQSLWWTAPDDELNKIINENLGPLSAIGEQKATQFFAQLASCFEPRTAAAYEAILTAWGGDVREQSVDLETGRVRPREITVEPGVLNKQPNLRGSFDPTVYARVDYLDPKANITEDEKASCETVLKNLPVVFTFAPMNILYYRAEFPAKSIRILTVSYKQYAYSDTRSPSSYQLAYLIHPASFWEDFGPINLEVTVPEGVRFRASDKAGIGPNVIQKKFKQGGPDIYLGTIEDKTGEIYMAVDAQSWKNSDKQVVMQ